MVAKGGEKKKNKGVEAKKEEENHPVEEKMEISGEKTASKGGKQSVKDSSDEEVDANQNLAVANPRNRKRRCVHKKERMKKRKAMGNCNPKIKKGLGGPGGPGGGDGGAGGGDGGKGGNDPGGAGGSMGIAA